MNVTLSGGPIVHQGKAAAYLAEYVNFFLRFALLSHSHVSVILVSSKFSAETILFRDPHLFSSTALSDPAFLDASPSLLGTAIIAASRVCTNNFFHDWPFRWTRLISCLHRLLLGCCLLGRYTCKGSLGMASWQGRLLVFKLTTICTGMVSSSWPDSPRSY